MRSVTHACLVRDGEIIQTVKATTVVRGDCFTTTYDPPIGPFSKDHNDQIKHNHILPHGRPPQCTG